MINISIILILISIISIYFNYNNIILILLSIELWLIGISILFIHYSIVLDDFYGITTAILLLTIGAAESALLLSFLVKFNKIK